MKRSDSIAKIAAALVKAQQGMGTAVKDSKNPFFKSNYADINAINQVLLPALHENGISVLQPPTTENGKNYIETVLLHETGEYLTSLNEVIVAKQNDPQSYLAAQTYTRRGALQAFLNIGSEDDDGNTANGRSQSKPAFTPPPAPAKTAPAPAKQEVAPQKTEAPKVGAAEAPAAGRRSFRKSTSSEDL